MMSLDRMCDFDKKDVMFVCWNVRFWSRVLNEWFLDEECLPTNKPHKPAGKARLKETSGDHTMGAGGPLGPGPPTYMYFAEMITQRSRPNKLYQLSRRQHRKFGSVPTRTNHKSNSSISRTKTNSNCLAIHNSQLHYRTGRECDADARMIMYIQ